MLRSVNDMSACPVRAQDGTVGHVDQFLFDDRSGVMGYIVVRISGWLFGRRVLILPQLARAIGTPVQMLDIALTRQQIEDSPDIATDPPVSHQRGAMYFERGGDPLGWEMLPRPWFSDMSGHGALWADGMTGSAEQNHTRQADPHLRSTHEVIGYRLQARDGAIGRIIDFIVDDTTWTIHSAVVSTGTWWPDKRVLLPWQRIERIRWVNSIVEVGVRRATVKRHQV